MSVELTTVTAERDRLGFEVGHLNTVIADLEKKVEQRDLLIKQVKETGGDVDNFARYMAAKNSENVQLAQKLQEFRDILKQAKECIGDHPLSERITSLLKG